MLRATSALVLLGALVGCDDLSEYRANDGKVFHGVVVGSDSEVGNTGDDSFIRRGFESQTELELQFEPELANLAGGSEQRSPGSVHTYICPSDVQFCDEPERVGLFDRTPLKPIPGLSHDALSRYEFPGGGRLRNYIFGASFRTELEERTYMRHAMVFLSLMDDGGIEARIIAPALLDSSEQELSPALFGVFSLERKSR